MNNDTIIVSVLSYYKNLMIQYEANRDFDAFRNGFKTIFGGHTLFTRILANDANAFVADILKLDLSEQQYFILCSDHYSRTIKLQTMQFHPRLIVETGEYILEMLQHIIKMYNIECHKTLTSSSLAKEIMGKLAQELNILLPTIYRFVYHTHWFSAQTNILDILDTLPERFTPQKKLAYKLFAAHIPQTSKAIIPKQVDPNYYAIGWKKTGQILFSKAQVSLNYANIKNNRFKISLF